jgi:hypothetical protein
MSPAIPHIFSAPFWRIKKRRAGLSPLPGAVARELPGGFIVKQPQNSCQYKFPYYERYFHNMKFQLPVPLRAALLFDTAGGV